MGKQHALKTRHKPDTWNDFRILSSAFKLPKDQKIAEAMLIKARKPNIDVKEASAPFKVF